eukprot:8096337-Prorocentrum_lima.AAC.1
MHRSNMTGTSYTMAPTLACWTPWTRPLHQPCAMAVRTALQPAPPGPEAMAALARRACNTP